MSAAKTHICTFRGILPHPLLSHPKEVKPVSWICDECSSNNDDDTLECFVCGARRSQASLREAARRRRREKCNAVGEVLTAKVFPALWIAALSAAALVVLGVILCVVTGRAFLSADRAISFGECLSGRASAHAEVARQSFARPNRPRPSKEIGGTFGERAGARLKSIFSPSDGEEKGDAVPAVMGAAAARRAEKIRAFFRTLSGHAAEGVKRFREILHRLIEAVRLRTEQWRGTTQEPSLRLPGYIRCVENVSVNPHTKRFVN